MRTVRGLIEQLSLIPDQDREIRVQGKEPVVAGLDWPYVNLLPGPYSTDDPEDVAEPHD
jgi:hypothetical protein